MEILAGVVGGFGFFIFGMWLLTENLRKLASRRLRQFAHRWTRNRFAALAWGAVCGGITQSMAALAFIAVGFVRSRMITLGGAQAMIAGGYIGTTGLVVIATFDIKVVALYVIGLAGAVAATDQLERYRTIAGSFLGGAMIVFGLMILKEAAAPMAEEPWFREVVESTGHSPMLALVVAAALTLVVQSSAAVSAFGISLAAVGVVSADQAIMIIYGSYIGSAAIVMVLSANLSGVSRQVIMYMVIANLLICAVVVPLLYLEIHLGIPSMKAVIDATGLELPQRLALVYVITCVAPAPFMLAALSVSTRMLERLWPESVIDELSRTHFIHDHATVDVETAMVLADLEQKRALRLQRRSFDILRDGGDVFPFRNGLRSLLGEIDSFLKELQPVEPIQAVEDRNALLNRQRLLVWLADSVDTMCDALLGMADRAELKQFRESMREGVDSVFLTLEDALDADDAESWKVTRALSGDRGEIMRNLRKQYTESDLKLDKSDLSMIFLATNAAEDIFFLLSKLEEDFNPFSPEETAP